MFAKDSDCSSSFPLCSMEEEVDKPFQDNKRFHLLKYFPIKASNSALLIGFEI